MIRLFTDVAEQFGSSDEGNKSSVRAIQSWQYLIGKARNRQLVKYSELANLMGYTDCRSLTSILGHLMFFCEQEGLPPLTIIVVNSGGCPGEGFTQVGRNELDIGRERTFNYDWFSVYPPSPEELKAAWDAAHNK
ncbi:MAG: hypothetical protein ABIF87_15755 [Pseudomonadota bacterium]